jgi:hypothetical protein
MILDIIVILMFFVIAFLVFKFFKGSAFKANKDIPISRILKNEAQALEELVLESAIQDSSIKLNDLERIILKLDGVQLLEFKNINNKGMYQGISLRVMDGLSYRVGEFSSKQKQALTGLDVGELIFTSDRLIFLGARESLELSLKKLLSVDIAGEMLEIHQTGRSKIIFFGGLNDAWQNYIVSSGDERFQKESGVLRSAFIVKELLK